MLVLHFLELSQNYDMLNIRRILQKLNINKDLFKLSIRKVRIL